MPIENDGHVGNVYYNNIDETFFRVGMDMADDGILFYRYGCWCNRSYNLYLLD